MTPKEKAKELVDSFSQKIYKCDYDKLHFTLKRKAKQCALIAVDEIRDNLPLITDIQNYWQEVKQEIEKL
jgi:hypothetical protein